MMPNGAIQFCGECYTYAHTRIEFMQCIDCFKLCLLSHVKCASTPTTEQHERMKTLCNWCGGSTWARESQVPRFIRPSNDRHGLLAVQLMVDKIFPRCNLKFSLHSTRSGGALHDAFCECMAHVVVNTVLAVTASLLFHSTIPSLSPSISLLVHRYHHCSM